MKYVIVKFEESVNGGPIAIYTEDRGPIVFPDRHCRHLYPVNIGEEVLVKITKTNAKGTTRFCQVVAGSDTVAVLREKRKVTQERITKSRQQQSELIVKDRIARIRLILQENGVTEKEGTIDMDGFTFSVTASSFNYSKRRVLSTCVGEGEVRVSGYGLDPRGNDLRGRVMIDNIKFDGQLLNDLGLRAENTDDSISHTSRLHPGV